MRVYESPNSRWFQHLTPLGWFLFVLIIYLGISYLGKWEPVSRLESHEPSAWRFGLEVILLSVNIPLVWAAWKEVRNAVEHYWLERGLIAMWAALALGFVMESSGALQKGAPWYPHASYMLMWTLALLIFAFGRKRRPLFGHGLIGPSM